MDAKQCERCKCFYPSLILPDLRDESWRYNLIMDCHPYPALKVDLCPECKKKLLKWLKGETKGETK